MKKKAKVLALISMLLLVVTGCSSKEKSEVESTPEQNVSENMSNNESKNESILETIQTGVVYANHSEFVKESKNVVSQFSNWLTKHNIENEISKDGYSVQNSITEVEENNIKYNRQVFLDTEAYNDEGKSFYGSYIVDLVYENHIQEEYTKDNEFIKLVYDVVKTYNDGLSIDDFVQELNAYANKEITEFSFANEAIKIYISNKNTTKKLSMQFKISIEDIVFDVPVKEYSTMVEFIEDSKAISQKINEKTKKLNDENNLVNKEGQEIYFDVSNNVEMTANLNGRLYQKLDIDIELMRASESTMSFKDELIENIYYMIENVYGEDLKNYYTLEDFKAIVESNTDTGTQNLDINGVGNTTLNMPYLSSGSIRLFNTLGSKGFIKSDLSYSHYGTPSAMELLDSLDDAVMSNAYIEIDIKIPVKAEGVTEYNLQFTENGYVLDDGTQVEPIISSKN